MSDSLWDVHLCAGSQVQVGALWLEGSGATGVNMSLVERLQQPDKVGTVRLKEKQKTSPEAVVKAFNAELSHHMRQKYININT